MKSVRVLSGALPSFSQNPWWSHPNPVNPDRASFPGYCLSTVAAFPGDLNHHVRSGTSSQDSAFQLDTPRKVRSLLRM